jgi:hypothetical protein
METSEDKLQTPEMKRGRNYLGGKHALWIIPAIVCCVISLVIWNKLSLKGERWVQLSVPPGYKLISVDGRNVSPHDVDLYLPSGPITFIYSKDNQLYSYTVSLGGGAEVYMNVTEADLVPVLTVNGT